jgi:iron complex outermembrane recepter protein
MKSSRTSSATHPRQETPDAFPSMRAGLATTTCPLFARHRIYVATICALFAGASYAQAPTSPTPAEKPKADESEKLETVTVTAQRREQELQSVPLPVSTFTATELASKGVDNALKLATFVPNMFASNNTGLGSANQYFLRGLGNTESIATFDPPVGTYINDIYISRQNANNFSFFDVERIEVLRGPQGTLFGRNTTGGAINVILKKPAAKLGGYIEVGGGNFDQRSSRGSVDVPMGEAFRTKFSYYFAKDDGYVDNPTTGERLNANDNFGVRGALAWRFSDAVSWDLAIDTAKDEGTSIQNTLVDGKRISRTGLRTDSRSFFSSSGAPLLTGEKNSYGLGNEVTTTSVSSNVNLSLGGASIDFITGWRDLKQKFAIDFFNSTFRNGGFTIANDGRHKQFSQEIKATGEITGVPLTYVAGLFYLNERNTTDFGDLFLSSAAGIPGPAFSLVLADRVLKNTTKSTAVYAQGDYKFLPDFTATLGIRYTDETKDISFSENRTGIAAASQLNDTNISASGIPLSQNTKLATPRAALAWQINKDMMLFASATRGFKSGGWNARGTAARELLPFSPEKVWSYEAGWRLSFANNAVRFNGTFFYSDTQDLQTPSAFIRPNGSLAFITRNFAGLRNQGLEMELTAVPTRGLTVFLNVGLQDAKYVDIGTPIIEQQARCQTALSTSNAALRAANCLQGIVTADGTIADPVRAPKTNIAPGFRYVFPIGISDLKVTSSLNWAYTSRTSVGTANNAFAEAHTVLNGSLGLLGGGDTWRLMLDCTNCTNRTWNTAFLAGFTYLNDPRRYTLKLNYTFK